MYYNKFTIELDDQWALIQFEESKSKVELKYTAGVSILFKDDRSESGIIRSESLKEGHEKLIAIIQSKNYTLNFNE